MLYFTTPAELIPKGYEQVTGMSSATTLTVPPGAAVALIQTEVQDVRFRDDGTDPTATVGMLLNVGEDPFLYRGDLSALRFFEDTAGAILNVTYYGQTA